jgi:L-iditol 2-dehydrogenase
VRVARLHGVGDLRVTDEPTPVTGPGESLVQVTAVGVCGSDLHWYADGGIGDATLERPLVLGHEFAGVIRGGPRDGQRVAVDPAVPCGACELCHAGHQNLCPTVAFAGHGGMDGALREFLAWPTELLHPLPSGVCDVDGALLEPLGVALHAVGLAHLRPGVTVGVFGCGPIGLLLVRLARLAGAGFVLATDPLGHRRSAAVAYGADVVLDPADELADVVADVVGLGVDVAFEVAGVDDAIDAALVAARPGARVVLVGIPAGDTSAFRASAARRKGLTLLLSRRMNAIYPRAIKLVERGSVDLGPLVTARFPLAEAGAAFADATARTGLKVVITP